MTTGLFFPTCCIFFSLLLCLIYFSKERLNNFENQLYKFLLLANLVSLVMEFLCTFVSFPDNFNAIISPLVVKIYLIILLVWITVFVVYMLYISKGKSTIRKKLWIVITVFLAVVILFLPTYFSMTRFGPAAAGPAVDILYVISFLYVAIWSVSLIFNSRNVVDKKFIPIGIYIVLGIVVAIVQKTNPGLLLITPIETLVTFIMYFTIENPDLKMISELNLAREAADRANNAKTEFLSSMSHEIRTPLNAIVGFSQALKDEEDIKESVKNDVKDIIMASDSLLEIVNGILDISKIEANKLEIINTEYDPSKILNELVTLTKGRLSDDKQIEFTYDFDDNIPSRLYGDYTRLKQIVLNILTNAVKYTEKGKIEFNVSCSLKNDICSLTISVEDTGMGIKEENMDKLFSKFERLDEEKNTNIEGTGLGLAITKKLVELMNGELTVESVYGEGSKFTVKIDQKIIKKEREEEKTIVVNTTSYKNKRILIVDDNKLNLKVAERLLRNYEVMIDAVESGADCILKIEMGIPYKMVLMDDMMPEMSGKETLAKLKENPDFKIPTIALTANAIAGMKEEYLALGFDDYLPKPIEKKELEKVLEKYLGEEE